ncbi:MAG: HAD family hydrolase [bacterium]
MKTLLIDFDGTLCYDRFWRSLESETTQKVQEYLFLSDNTIVKDWMNGIHTSEDVNKKVSEKLGLDYKYLWNLFVKDCQTMQVDEMVLSKIMELKKDYKIILVTDNMDCFDRFTIPALKLNEYFDEVVNSFNERTSKNENEGQLFSEVIERLGSTLSESILMDNSEKTCEIFNNLGGTSCLVTKEKPLIFWLDKEER